MKWTVFDFEFTSMLPQEHWTSMDLIKDIHISCASIFSTGETWPQVWYERNDSSGDFMSEATLCAFVDNLYLCKQSGFTIVTWGGASSDWRFLLKECPTKKDLILSLALDSIDLPMCSCMSIGVMMGLNAACKALGYSLKDDQASANVPEMWNSGKRQEVLQHVSNDSYATMLVVVQAYRTKTLPWITQKGHYKSWTPVQFWTIRECLAKELPSTPYVLQPHQNAKLMARWLLFEQ